MPESEKPVVLAQLPESFARLGRVAVTTGRFELATACSARDLDWNHMDQEHRPRLHGTYTEAVRLAMGRDFSTSLTRISWLGLKFLVLVTDTRVAEGVFHQYYTLFNLLFIHNVVENGADRIKVTWRIASHPFFRFLHGPLSRRIRRLNEVQLREDAPVRSRRAELRGRGYEFCGEPPDYLNSNDMSARARPPALLGKHKVELGLLRDGLNKVAVGPIDLLIAREGGESVKVWPAACPHEGGPLDQGTLNGGGIQCPWHGLKFLGLCLTRGEPKGVLGGLALEWEADCLFVRQAG